MLYKNIKKKSLLKNFLYVFLPVVISLGIIFTAYYQNERKNEKTIFEARELTKVNTQRKIIPIDLRAVVSDLRFLSQLHEMRKVIDGKFSSKNDLADDLQIIIGEKNLYDQIRLLDETGFETVRINYNNGIPEVIPEDKLQDKSNRYYFKETFTLNNNEIFISQLDLNIEQGQIEQPIKPMIRFGTPVFDSEGRKRGIILLNYLGARLLDDPLLLSDYYGSDFMLINSDGYWLKHSDPEKEWGFMYEGREQISFEYIHPEAWKIMSESDAGQFYSEEGLFTFDTFYHFELKHNSIVSSGKLLDSNNKALQNSKYYWKVISYMPSSTINANSNSKFKLLVVLYIGIIAALAVGVWQFTVSKTKREIAIEALSVNEKLLESVINNTSSVIYIKDLEGKYILINNQFEHRFKVSKIEIVGKTDFDIFPPKKAQELIDNDKKVLISETIVEIEEIIPQDDIIHVFISVKFPLLNLNGNPYAICGISTDITERKRTEEERIKNEKLKGVLEMAGAACHEMNQPLQIILGYSSMISSSLADDSPIKSKMEVINQNTERMGEITRRLQSISKYETMDYLEGKIIDINKASKNE